MAFNQLALTVEQSKARATAHAGVSPLHDGETSARPPGTRRERNVDPRRIWPTRLSGSVTAERGRE